MKSKQTYTVKEFNLRGLQGISDKTLEMHLKLYEGYVKATNTLNEKIAGILEDGKVDQEEMPAYSELTRRLGFEYNGMVLHELYFENMSSQGSKGPQSHPAVEKAIQDSFGSVDLWKTDFSSVGKMRGVGWAICYQNPENGRLSNHWVSLHEFGNVAGFKPLLVLDVWEHAYLLDYQPSERGKYIESFLANVNWAVVAKRQ
jgi:superoxide dismutase, Fe-Mn family